MSTTTDPKRFRKEVTWHKQVKVGDSLHLLNDPVTQTLFPLSSALTVTAIDYDSDKSNMACGSQSGVVVRTNPVLGTDPRHWIDLAWFQKPAHLT